MDNGFTFSLSKTSEKESITKKDVEQILEIDCGEYRIAPKLKERHFSCKGSERQRVLLAAQLLSAHTAAALLQVSPDKRAQSKFIKTANDWFDVANSRRKEDSNELKSGPPLSTVYCQFQFEANLGHRFYQSLLPCFPSIT